MLLTTKRVVALQAETAKGPIIIDRIDYPCANMPLPSRSWLTTPARAYVIDPPLTIDVKVASREPESMFVEWDTPCLGGHVRDADVDDALIIERWNDRPASAEPQWGGTTRDELRQDIADDLVCVYATALEYSQSTTEHPDDVQRARDDLAIILRRLHPMDD